MDKIPPRRNNERQLSEEQIKNLEKSGYRMAGNHSAVKVCYWTKRMINNGGGCYKFIFYGIRSHQCLQMTTSMFCASRCSFCWRGQKAPVGREWYGPIDSPQHIINHAIDAHLGLLEGFNGSQKANPRALVEKDEVRHVALSLTGEPITYPLIDKILDAFHNRRISTFLVSNAQFPEQMKKVKHITQLYLSLDAPNKDLLRKIDNPLFDDYYENLCACLDLLHDAPYRTCIRLTLIKKENMTDIQGYVKHIRRGNPHFIELKSYMFSGASRERLSMKNVPTMEEVKAFTNDLLEALDEYEQVSEHVPSGVTLLVRKDFKQYQYIDFVKFFDLLKSGKDFRAEEYGAPKMMANG